MPVIPDDFEETNDDSAVFATPRQHLDKTTPGSLRRSSRIQSQTPTETSKTPKEKRLSAPEKGRTIGTPQRVLTPKNNKHAPQPQRIPAPKVTTPKAERIPTPKSTRSKRYSEPATPKSTADTGKKN